jgi:hypothetical protein
MSKEYTKDCNFCKTKIHMVETGGKWAAYNLDNGLHNCQKKQEPSTQEQTNHKEITLAQVLKKLESIGIIINVERLMKE